MSKNRSSHAYAFTVVMALSIFASPSSIAQESYPSRPVKMIIGFGPGSGIDGLGRLVAEEMRSTFKQQFIIENRPGAASMLAPSAVKAASPDGYTLLLASSTSQSINPHIFKKVPYDPIADFTPIGSIGQSQAILAVNETVPATTAQEFVSWAQANKGSVFYAYSGMTFRVAAESINRSKMLDAKGVPYKSSPDAMNDVIGGRAQFLVVDLSASRGLVKAGRLRALALASSKRSPLAPDLPTVEETLGLRDFDMASWVGLFGPANLPQDIVDKLSGALLKALARPEFREKMLAINMEPIPNDPPAFKVFLQRQSDYWKQKVAEAGIEPE